MVLLDIVVYIRCACVLRVKGRRAVLLDGPKRRCGGELSIANVNLFDHASRLPRLLHQISLPVALTTTQPFQRLHQRDRMSFPASELIPKLWRLLVRYVKIILGPFTVTRTMLSSTHSSVLAQPDNSLSLSRPPSFAVLNRRCVGLLLVILQLRTSAFLN